MGHDPKVTIASDISSRQQGWQAEIVELETWMAGCMDKGLLWDFRKLLATSLSSGPTVPPAVPRGSSPLPAQRILDTTGCATAYLETQ